MLFGMIHPLLFLGALGVITGVNAAAITSSSTSTGVHNLPINITSSVVLDYATDDEFNPAIYRDGGGGGLVNGYHVAVFCDSWTTTSPGGLDDSGTSFVHNTITYMGVVRGS